MKRNNDIAHRLAELRKTGGRILLPVGEYELGEPLVLDVPSTRLEGEVWAYNLDPNGVFETPYGTKLRLKGRSFPALSVGVEGIPAGVIVRDLGIQGDLRGMDTRPLLDPHRFSASAGLHFGGQRVDQGEFSKISCCGLAVAVCADGNAEIDACCFEKINMDGCCIGVYYSPRASYYAHFRQCIVADTPSFGFYFDSTGRSIHNVDVTDVHFVRNCGSSPLAEEPAAVYWRNVSRCAFRDNLVDAPGTFWYYGEDAADNRDKQVIRTPAVGLKVEGHRNRITGNTFLNSSRESVLVVGNGNVLMNNLADGNVILEGEGNVVSGLVFTSPEACLILRGAARESTSVMAVEPSRIRRE